MPNADDFLESFLPPGPRPLPGYKPLLEFPPLDFTAPPMLNLP
ncbi:hypothetical protein Pla123a_41860 [Posidoniimonas polymericola]|uniref:Uncharacterized protein n=1 Tax=Posidoniimonas polymericola TaxID=2528002 RepID=A0A5C5XXE7_9BACT|nr:hypothetical protein [Posidoniimonas polymericola]TWT67630.1 hypothetical protein Pla123a_41860 [Posidoniimonas polymericola]